VGRQPLRGGAGAPLGQQGLQKFGAKLSSPIGVCALGVGGWWDNAGVQGRGPAEMSLPTGGGHQGGRSPRERLQRAPGMAKKGAGRKGGAIRGDPKPGGGGKAPGDAGH